MESRKRLFKAGPRDLPTLSERVNRVKSRREAARKDKFNAGRQISVNESPKTPALAKISQITDRKEKLQAYRMQKNSKKFKEIQEQKSPFILAVPVGRWVEKKERFKPAPLMLNDTPVRKMLMSEKVLKKSTVKDLVKQSTVKKENLMVFGKTETKPVATKSKKKILTEFNSVDDAPITPLETEDLNSTFEISPEAQSSENIPVAEPPRNHRRRSKSFSGATKKAAVVSTRKVRTPPAKLVAKKEVVKKFVPKAVIKKPVEVKKQAVSVKKATKSYAEIVKKPSREVKIQPTTSQSEITNDPVPVAKPAKKPKKSQHSTTYTLFKSSLETQIRFLTMQLQEIESNKGIFFDALLDDEQVTLNKTIQQGHLLITDKLGKFEEFLDKFEADQSSTEVRKRVTDEDVENYWYLIYDEIDVLKKDLEKVKATMKDALKAVASAKKRAQKSYNTANGTPRRSRRIAVNAETPKHAASGCHGCVALSASKVNTPKSASKRRTTIKKSVLFDNVADTPKRSDSKSRSSRRYKATPKRNLMRMNAVEKDDTEFDFEGFV